MIEKPSEILKSVQQIRSEFNDITKEVCMIHKLLFSRDIYFDLRGRPTVLAGTDLYFTRGVYPSVKISQNKILTWVMVATGGTVGLAKGIIDDKRFLLLMLNSL